jgi:hypothetical protein
VSLGRGVEEELVEGVAEMTGVGFSFLEGGGVSPNRDSKSPTLSPRTLDPPFTVSDRLFSKDLKIYILFYHSQI